MEMESMKTTKTIAGRVKRWGRKALRASRGVARGWASLATGEEWMSGRLLGRGHAPQPWEGQARRPMTPQERDRFGQRAGWMQAQAEAIQLSRAVEIDANPRSGQGEPRRIRRL